MLVLATIAATLDGPQLREFLFPVTQHVRFDAAQIAYFTNREITLRRNRWELNENFVALHWVRTAESAMTAIKGPLRWQSPPLLLASGWREKLRHDGQL